MSVGYSLINITKKERIIFSHINASTALELTGNSVASAITTWYLLKNRGDIIGFIPDQYNQCDKECPFKNISRKDICEYRDITDKIVSELIENNILQDNGKEIFDEDEPNIYIRKLKNIWGRN